MPHLSALVRMAALEGTCVAAANEWRADERGERSLSLAMREVYLGQEELNEGEEGGARDHRQHHHRRRRRRCLDGVVPLRRRHKDN